MIDVHCHIIPNIDDGSPDFEESCKMFEKAIEAGFTDLIATSHFLENYYEADSKSRQDFIDNMNKELVKRGLNLNLHCGNEIYITPNLINLIKENKASTLAGSRYVLFELPMNQRITYLSEVIFEIKANGMVPVIAHPERYVYVQENPNFVVELVKNGVLFQSNFASINGYYGNKARKTLIKLLKANTIHFLGSDTHRSLKYTMIRKDIKKLKRIISKEKLEQLTTINPKHILEDQEIQIEEPTYIKRLFYFGKEIRK